MYEQTIQGITTMIIIAIITIIGFALFMPWYKTFTKRMEYYQILEAFRLKTLYKELEKRKITIKELKEILNNNHKSELDEIEEEITGQIKNKETEKK